jgi:hypothetical protein
MHGQTGADACNAHDGWEKRPAFQAKQGTMRRKTCTSRRDTHRQPVAAYRSSRQSGRQTDKQTNASWPSIRARPSDHKEQAGLHHVSPQRRMNQERARPSDDAPSPRRPPAALPWGAFASSTSRQASWERRTARRRPLAPVRLPAAHPPTAPRRAAVSGNRLLEPWWAAPHHDPWLPLSVSRGAPPWLRPASRPGQLSQCGAVRCRCLTAQMQGWERGQ